MVIHESCVGMATGFAAVVFPATSITLSSYPSFTVSERSVSHFGLPEPAAGIVAAEVTLTPANITASGTISCLEQ